MNLRGTYDTAGRLKEAVNHFCRITRTFVVSFFLYFFFWIFKSYQKRLKLKILTLVVQGFGGDEVGDFFRPRLVD